MLKTLKENCYIRGNRKNSKISKYVLTAFFSFLLTQPSIILLKIFYNKKELISLFFLFRFIHFMLTVNHPKFEKLFHMNDKIETIFSTRNILIKTRSKVINKCPQ